jgi:hypothetical protein
MKIGLCVFLTAIVLGIAAWTVFHSSAAIKYDVNSVEIVEKVNDVKPNVSQKEVVFEGVSFIYETDLFSEIKSERVKAQPLADATHKPDSVYPQHTKFTLSNNSKNKSTSEISVYSVEEYKQAYSVEKHYVNIVTQNFKKLKQILDKPSRLKASSQVQLPFIQLIDAHQVFHARAKVVRFNNGKGLLFLTQHSQDAIALINNQEIEYIYQGLTDNGKHFVFMSFSVSTDELPGDYDDLSHRNYVDVSKLFDNIGKNQKSYSEYTNRISAELNKLPAEKFEPNLNKIESLINSLKIK